MKSNLRYIIGILSVALGGIILFQAYWIVNSFDLHSRMFRSEVNGALESVINEEIEIRTIGRIFEAQDTAASPIEIQAQRPSGGTGPDQYFIDREDMDRIINQVVVSLATIHPEINEIELKYREALYKLGITTPFYLAFSENDKIYSQTGGDTEQFSRAQAVQKLPGLAMNREKVLAFFPEDRSYILKRMWLTLLASLLLISLTGGSFYYLLSTLIKQRKLSEIKNDFINNMTHELKTPIATVAAAMEALVNFNAISDRDKSLRYIDLSRKELTRLSGMVENVLRLSTFEKQKLVLFKETFDVCQVLEEISQQFILQNEGRVEFRFNLAGPGYIHADKFHLQNVISNLYDNAIKYSQGDAVIEVSCSRTNEFVVFTVKDNGMGITREQQQHIFEKFYRVPTGNLHAVKGFGLGLAYVRQIIEIHGGTIGVKSQPGNGSEFTIAIPEIQ